jgi:PAS domain S-box-containing protein
MTRVLIVDDDKNIRTVFTNILQKKGYEVESVGDGEKALSLIKDHDFDVIILDIILPGLSGLDIIETIKRVSPLSKIIMFTGQPSVETILNALRAGANDYLSKPVKPEDLLVVVSNAARIKALELENKKYRERLENLVSDRTLQIHDFNERLQHIAEETRSFSLCENTEELAGRILGLLSRNMSASGGSLFWRENDHLQLIAAIDPGHQQKTIALPAPSESVFARIFEGKAGFVVSDIKAGAKIEPSGWTGYKNGSLLALPYQNEKGEILGVLTLHNKEKPPFTQQDLKVGRIISAHSLEAFKNIQLKSSLAESETKYRNMSDSSLTGIYIHRDGKLVYCNPKMVAMLGYSLDQYPSLLGQPFIKYVHLLDQEIVKSRASRRLSNEIPIDHYAIRLVEKNGRVIWVDILVSLIEHEGHPALMGNVIDITSRKKAEGEIAERNKELTILNRFIRASNEAVSLSELLEYVLKGLLEWLGFDGGGIYLLDNSERFATLRIHAGLPEEFVEQVSSMPTDKAPHNVIFAKGKPLYMENYPGKFPNRAAFSDILSLASVPIFSGERIIGAINVASRKTYVFPDSVKSMLKMIGNEIGNSISRLQTEDDREKLESQLRQSQKMEAVGRLAGGIAHDFNNILTGVNGYAELILESLVPENPLHPQVTEIKKAAVRAARLTEQLLGFSRKQVIAPITANLNDLIDDSSNMLARVIEEDVEFEFVPGDNLGNVKIDPHQLDQILVNLVVNGRDAMLGRGGKLVIETKNLCMDAEYCSRYPWAVPGDYVMLAVSDTGVGIPEEILTHIFEPFYTTKEKGKGTGLGLSTVYGIVKQNNGFINVYTEEGIGTTFRVYLPLVQGPIKPKTKTVDVLSKKGTETVLLVEDEEMVRDLAETILTRHGYNVINTECGADAVEMCKTFSGKIHLLLTDVIMPGMTGREVFEKVKTIRPEIRVLYMSGYTENVIAHHGVLQDGSTFIPKPFSVDGLAKKVREILDA